MMLANPPFPPLQQTDLPVPTTGDTLVITDNGDIFGTIDDLVVRSAGAA